MADENAHTSDFAKNDGMTSARDQSAADAQWNDDELASALENETVRLGYTATTPIVVAESPVIPQVHGLCPAERAGFDADFSARLDVASESVSDALPTRRAARAAERAAQGKINGDPLEAPVNDSESPASLTTSRHHTGDDNTDHGAGDSGQARTEVGMRFRADAVSEFAAVTVDALRDIAEESPAVDTVNSADQAGDSAPPAVFGELLSRTPVEGYILTAYDDADSQAEYSLPPTSPGSVAAHSIFVVFRIFAAVAMAAVCAGATIWMLTASSLSGSLERPQLNIFGGGVGVLLSAGLTYLSIRIVAMVRLMLAGVSAVIIVVLIVVAFALVDARAANPGISITVVVTCVLLAVGCGGLVWAKVRDERRQSSSGSATPAMLAAFGIVIPPFVFAACSVLIVAGVTVSPTDRGVTQVEAISRQLPAWYPIAVIVAFCAALLAGIAGAARSRSVPTVVSKSAPDDIALVPAQSHLSAQN